MIEQTVERMKREMEADDADYEKRLAKARQREHALKLKARAKVTKKPVSNPVPLYTLDVRLN